MTTSVTREVDGKMDVIIDVEVAREVPTFVQSHTAYQTHTNLKLRDDIVIAIAILGRIGIVRGKGEKKIPIVQAEEIGPGIDADHEIVILGGTTGDGAAKGI